MSKRALLDIRAYMTKKERAIPVLADYLAEGGLALAIGAGASAGLGLAQWKQLVERCAKETNKLKGTHIPEVIPDDFDNKKVCELVDQVEEAVGGKLNMGRSLPYRQLVKSCLYQGVQYDRSMLQKELLIAIGALLMGSKRGSVKEVFSFNFDDVLDWYLALHGFDTQIITTLPTFRRAPDVTIYHPHGYLPHMIKSHPESDFLIFSQHAYEEKLGDRQESWLGFFQQVMEERVFLFLGLSGDDQTFGRVIVDVEKKIKGERYTGFWICGPDVEASRVAYLSKRNIVPLCFSAFGDIPDFLLSICQRAVHI